MPVLRAHPLSQKRFYLALIALLILSVYFFSPSPPPSPTRDPALDARFAAALARPPPPGAPPYAPARIEAQWAANAREWGNELCARVAAERELWQRWLDGAAAGGAGTPLEAWSTLGAAGLGEEAAVRLEPLAGYLRDPRPSCPSVGLTPLLTRDTEDAKAHIFLDPAYYALLAASLRRAPAAGQPQPRALLFDIGSTLWQGSPDSETGLSGASWLVDAYGKLGIEFDAVHAWEASPKNAREYFGAMPLALAAKWHFYNFPVTSPAIAGSGGPGPENVLEVLRTVARPGDFVVFKIDIDAEVLEEKIVLELLADDALGALVDDFYFEHHVRNSVMGPRGWGNVQLRDVQDSIGLFQALRRRGIRAHSWP